MTRREYGLHASHRSLYCSGSVLYPKPFLDKMTTSVEHLLQKVDYHQKAQKTMTTEGQKIAALKLNHTLQNRALSGRE